MNALSRRQFLKRSGAVAWFGLNRPTATNTPDIEMSGTVGRAFTLTDLYRKPDPASAVIGRLLPDSVTPIVETLETPRNGAWYRVAQGDLSGYVPCEAMQPILPYVRPDVIDVIGDGLWAEMIAPYSAVHEWCAGAAPIVTRLGFGAVVYVMDRMLDDYRQVWYGLTDAPGSALIGWAPALHYKRWTPTRHEQPTALLVRNRELLVYNNHRLLGRANIQSQGLTPLTTTIEVVQPGAAVNTAIPLGLPWLMRSAVGTRIHGVFWHNRFGEVSNNIAITSSTLSASSIEMSTFAARWLYERLESCDQPVPLTVE